MDFTFQGEIIKWNLLHFYLGFGIVVHNSIENFTADYPQESEQPSYVEHFFSNVLFLPVFHFGL